MQIKNEQVLKVVGIVNTGYFGQKAAHLSREVDNVIALVGAARIGGEVSWLLMGIGLATMGVGALVGMCVAAVP